MPESFFTELNEPSKNVEVDRSRSIFGHTKRLRSTYIPKSADPKDDLIIESIFTGTIVSFMLITLIFMVIRRGIRFGELRVELKEQKKMREEKEKYKECIKSTEMGTFLRQVVRISRPGGSINSNKLGKNERGVLTDEYEKHQFRSVVHGPICSR